MSDESGGGPVKLAASRIAVDPLAGVGDELADAICSTDFKRSK